MSSLEAFEILVDWSVHVKGSDLFVAKRRQPSVFQVSSELPQSHAALLRRQSILSMLCVASNHETLPVLLRRSETYAFTLGAIGGGYVDESPELFSIDLWETNSVCSHYPKYFIEVANS